jgi:hypothetical protein
VWQYRKSVLLAIGANLARDLGVELDCFIVNKRIEEFDSHLANEKDVSESFSAVNDAKVKLLNALKAVSESGEIAWKKWFTPERNTKRCQALEI